MTEQEYRDFIYKKAEEVKSEDELLNLIKEIKEYPHDYGTIVYGCMAAALASVKVINKGPRGGITGFQASCIGWECVKKFMSVTPESPLKLIQYHNMLYPQYESSFDKTIDLRTWTYISEKAKEMLTKDKGFHPNVQVHLESIARGKVPFGYTLKED